MPTEPEAVLWYTFWTRESSYADNRNESTSWTKSMRLIQKMEKVDNKLKDIMRSIHTQCVKYGKTDNKINYVKGANIAGFIKVADSMIDQGVRLINRGCLNII